MHRTSLTLLALAVSGQVLAAGVPGEIAYQGFLTQGNLPVEGTHNLEFAIFPDSTSGSPLWQEGPQAVPIANGVFKVPLGRPTAFPADLFSAPNRFLETKVDGQVLTPRTRLAAVPYAVEAVRAVHAVRADTAAFAESGGTGESVWQVSGQDISYTAGNVGIGTATPGAVLDVFLTDQNRALNSSAGYGDGVTGNYVANFFQAAYGPGSTGNLTGLHVNVQNQGSGDAHAATFTGGDLYLSTVGAAVVRLEGTGPNGQAIITLEADAGRSYQLNARTDGTFDISDETANASRMVITPNGDVGFGAAPTSPLHVQRDGQALVQIQGAGAGGQASLRLNAEGGHQYQFNARTGGTFDISDETTNRAPLRVEGGAPTDALVVMANGRIGVNHVTPGAGVGIAGYGQNEAGIELLNTSPGAGTWQILSGNDNSLNFWSNSLQNYPMTLRASGNVGIGTTNPTAKLDVAGDMCVTGAKNAIVPTSQGMTKLYCDESTELWFSDRGRARLQAGRARVNVDPLFLETVTVDETHPLEVWISFRDPHGDYYARSDRTGFDVIDSSGSDAAFSWKVEAKRKGYEGVRLEPVVQAHARLTQEGH